MNSDLPTLMDRLRTRTAEAHTAAENHAFQQKFIKGLLSKDGYVNYLGQMWLIHRSLEGHLRILSNTFAAIKAVVREYQYQEPYLSSDLDHFAVDLATVSPTPETARLVAEIDRYAAEQPYALLGMHYVLEGSNNGSRHLARSIRHAYNLDTGQGDRYLDPYGSDQRPYWQQFKDDMNAAEVEPADQDAIETGATAMFTGIMRISDDLEELIPA